MDDPFRALAEVYALGALEGPELAGFRDHLASGCRGCRDDVTAHQALLQALSREVPVDLPGPRVREQLLELIAAPRPPLDLGAYGWEEAAPGIKVHVVKEDPSRGLRACLVWARPGATHARHRHLGEEVILVLQGRIRDGRGVFGPGEICRSLEGSVHSEEAMPGEDCICYVLYYGDLEMLEGT